MALFNFLQASQSPPLPRFTPPLLITPAMCGRFFRSIASSATDDLGYSIVEKLVHIHDLQATLLHCLGLDHERLTFRYAGRDFRLTDVHGEVVKDILM